MSPIPDFILDIRRMIGTHPLWLPGVTAVIRRDDEILMVERADNGAWTPVTGIVDPGEEPAVAAAREALEETGVGHPGRPAGLGLRDLGGRLRQRRPRVVPRPDLRLHLDQRGGVRRPTTSPPTCVGGRWTTCPRCGRSMSQRVADALADEREARFTA